MEESEKVFELCGSKEDSSVELATFLEAHPDVDVNLFQDSYGGRSIYAAAFGGRVACTRLLIDAKADLEVRDKDGFTALRFASNQGTLECLQVLIESKADVNTADDDGDTPAHSAAATDHPMSLGMLIDAKADVNVKNMDGQTPAMGACMQDSLTCLQLLVDAKADLSEKTKNGLDVVFMAITLPPNEPSHRVPGMPFAVLSCNTDSKNVPIDDRFFTQAALDTDINEFTRIQSFINECHTVTEHALSEDVVVDTRMGRGDHGLYHEPLEQVLLYLGLSMKKNQTVNASIDGNTGTRALMPGHPTNANMWFELYQRTHCSSCSARPAKLKTCPCDTARYCNIDCQRKHWKTHKPGHNAAMTKKKKKK
jgi:hypothetical protein